MHAIREALNGMRRAPFLTLLSSAMVALALFVVGLFAVVTYNLHQTLTRIEERVEVVAYLRDDTQLEEVFALEDELLAMEEVRATRYISKDDALAMARADLPEFQEIFAGLEVNPLPASIEVEIHPGFRNPESVSRIAGTLTLHPAVEDVAYGQDWVERLFLLRRIGAIATGVLGGAFAVVAALIIGTAIRIAIFARREEIYIMRLVGATDGFIRRPFLLEGFLTGLLGGGMAAGLTWGAFQGVHRIVFQLDWIPADWVLMGIGAGGIFGLLASGLAVRRHLREI
jgi:cell division transport system permease protein